jgi:hypothetical protein
MRPEECGIPAQGVLHISTINVTVDHCRQTIRVCVLNWEPGWRLVVGKRCNHKVVEMIRGLATALFKANCLVAETAARTCRSWQFFTLNYPTSFQLWSCKTSTFLSLVRHYGSFISIVAGGDCHSICGLRQQVDFARLPTLQIDEWSAGSRQGA